MFATGVFSQSDWPGGATSAAAFGANSTGGSLSDVASGGNPGSYVEMSASHGTGDYFVWTAVAVNSWVYDPSVSGAIASIDFGADVMRQQGIDFDDFQALIVQNGKYYWDFGALHNVSGWFDSSATGATAHDFRQINTSDGTWNGGLNPDFSSTGAPISFGYALGVQGTADAGSITQSYDNIHYRIRSESSTPEPFTLGLGLAGAGLFVRRRLKSKDSTMAR